MLEFQAASKIQLSWRQFAGLLNLKRMYNDNKSLRRALCIFSISTVICMGLLLYEHEYQARSKYLSLPSTSTLYVPELRYDSTMDIAVLKLYNETLYVPEIKYNSTVDIDSFISKSYNETFRVFEKSSCNNTEMPAALCFRMILAEQHKGFPWWFQTMLRDAVNPYIGLFGVWHDFSTNEPAPLRMCSIEKIASTQWRKVFRKLNGDKSEFDFRKKGLPADTPRFVMLRDPLERFLSAFLDKCIVRNGENMNHCESLRGFNITNKRKLFATFVDLLPLKWNMHFFPQALYCDGLYRHINKDYDFVGIMGPRFYYELERLSQRFGEPLASVVSDVFNLKKKTKTKYNFGIETPTASRVKAYYTAETLSRVLQYVSIDYIALPGLKLPKWAVEMLLRV